MARQDFAEHYARKDFQELLGRDPTAAELAQVVPVYMGADKYTHDTVGGKSAVAALARAEQESPDRLEKKKREELAAKAPEFYGQVGGLFQSSIGRDATDAEKKHFGSLLASGDVDEYTLNQFLQQLPEYTQKQDTQFRGELGTELQGQNERYFNEKILPSIQSQFAKQGRSVDSSGYATALAQAAKEQNTQRESFLTNLSANQYAGRQGAAREDYRTAQNRYFGGQDYARDRSANLSDTAYGRINELQNYNIQQKAYEDYLRRYGKRNSSQGIGSLVGGLAGMGGAFVTGNPAAAGTGYSIGTGVGGGAEALLRR